MIDKINIYDTKNLDNIPKELKNQLSKNEKKPSKNDNILTLIREANKPVTVDELLIALYRKYRITSKRHSVLNTIARLVQKKIIESVSKGSGIYQIKGKNHES